MTELQPEVLEEETIDIKALLLKFARKWYLFLFSLIFFVIVAFCFSKFSKSIYQVSTTVLIQDDKTKSSMSPEDFMEGLGLFAGQKNLQNEIGVLQSYSLVNQVVKELDLGVSYFSTENFIRTEYYKNSPFIIEFDSSHPQPINVKFSLTYLPNDQVKVSIHEDDEVDLYSFKNDTIIGQVNELDLDKTIKIGETIETAECKFKVVASEYPKDLDYQDKDYTFLFNSLHEFTLFYKKMLEVKTINKDASIVTLTIEGSNGRKSTEFLATLTSDYLQRNLNNKNQIAIKTIEFIDDQLTEITDSLSYTENKLEEFRSKNKVMDLSFQAEKMFEKMQELDTEQATLEVKSKYYHYLKNYLEKNQDLNDILAPSTMGIEDPLLGKLVLELSELNSEKGTIMMNTKGKNPSINIVNQKIENARANILENVNNIIKTSDIALQDIAKRMADLVGEADKLPKTERELFGIERQFKLNDDVYTYLMQKRAEAQIAKASNMPDNEVIDKAMLVDKDPISPKPKVNYIIAICLALLLPAIFIVAKDYIADQITDLNEIEKITRLPILGKIAYNRKGSNLIVHDSPKSPISESFRSVRTNLKFFSQSKDKQTILVTSSVSGEGKTFCAMNLAAIFAQSGKKTVLVGFDLRKPRIYGDFNMTNDRGVSTFLIGQSNLNEVVQHSHIPNLHIIMAGPIPPNPVELIDSEKTTELFNILKEQYDCVIIDTAPMGLVTDTYLLTKYSDINIYVLRQHYTHRRVFAATIKEVEKNKFKNLNLLINNVRFAAGYGYGYGYYEDTSQDSGIKKLYKKIFKG